MPMRQFPYLQQFDYDMPRCWFYLCFLIWVPFSFLQPELCNFYQVWKKFGHYLFKYFFYVLCSLSSPVRNAITHVLDHLKVSLDALSIMLSVSFLCISFGLFLLVNFQIHCFVFISCIFSYSIQHIFQLSHGSFNPQTFDLDLFYSSTAPFFQLFDHMKYKYYSNWFHVLVLILVCQFWVPLGFLPHYELCFLTFLHAGDF